MTVRADYHVAAFDTKLPHWFGSTGDEPAEILSIFGRPGERMTVRTAIGQPEAIPDVRRVPGR